MVSVALDKYLSVNVFHGIREHAVPVSAGWQLAFFMQNREPFEDDGRQDRGGRHSCEPGESSVLTAAVKK